jgi:GntR family transcriptional regulator, carbon starvation induced regulator
LRTSGPEAITLTSEVFARLREDLLEGRFKPSQKLRLEELRSIYSVGFSPLREALMRLASDGLVTAEDRRGFRAAPISPQDLAQITQAREDIEEIALRDALEHGGDEWEGEIISALHRLSKVPSVNRTTGAVDQEWARRHHAFHYALIAAARNRWIVRFWGILYDQADRYRRIAVISIPDGRLDEHRLLMEAAIARDTDRLLVLSREHIRRTADLAQPVVEAESAPVLD